MPYNTEYRKEEPRAICRKLAYVLNGFRNRIAFDDADLSFIVGGCAFKHYYDFVSEAAYQVVLSCKSRYVHGTSVEFDGYVGNVGGHQVLIREHVVPVRVQLRLLKEAVERGPISEDYCAAFISRYAKIGLITKREDDRLIRANLRSRMPNRWTAQDGFVFARYDEVGINGYIR